MSYKDYFIYAKETQETKMGRTIGLWEEQPENVGMGFEWGGRVFTPPPEKKEKEVKKTISLEKEPLKAKRQIIIRRRSK